MKLKFLGKSEALKVYRDGAGICLFPGDEYEFGDADAARLLADFPDDFEKITVTDSKSVSKGKPNKALKGKKDK